MSELWIMWPLVLVGAVIGIGAAVLAVAFEVEVLIQRYRHVRRG